MASNTDSSKESDISLDTFQPLSQRDAAESEEQSQLSSDGRAQVLQPADVNQSIFLLDARAWPESICMNHTTPTEPAQHPDFQNNSLKMDKISL
ncbi:hypothetical protein AMECASPLE_031428 [Ameca splendens]|uniref:Uncharacterized protein n=1 Tax=Ameca splendens TaxID=208324 RepID=A0ABV0YU30_9TELE